MKIETRTTLIFEITSDNPPHDVAVSFIKAAAKAYKSEVHTFAKPMPEGCIDQRTTVIHITDDDQEYLRTLASSIANAMRLIGVDMSEEEKAA